MDIITKNLENVTTDMLKYGKEDAVEKIIITVFETILRAERSEYLLNNKKEGNKANGYYSRLIKSVNKYCDIQIPRDRLALFQPVFLDILKEKEADLQKLAFQMYSRGLSTRDITQIFKDIYGKSLSATSVSNITKEFEEKRKEWQNRQLEEEYYFIYMDALYVPIRRDTVEKEAVYVLLGLRKDLKRDIIGVYNVPTETKAGCEEIIKDIQKRGVKNVLAFIADGLKGLEDVINYNYPSSFFQKCLVHKKRNVLKVVRSSKKEEVLHDFDKVFNLGDPNYTYEKGLENLKGFKSKWGVQYPKINRMFPDEQVKYFFTYLNFPFEIRRMIYSTNWIERLNKEIRKTQRRRNSFPNPDSALNLICAFLVTKEQESYNVYPVTSFRIYKDVLDDMLLKKKTQFT